MDGAGRDCVRVKLISSSCASAAVKMDASVVGVGRTMQPSYSPALLQAHYNPPLHYHPALACPSLNIQPSLNLPPSQPQPALQPWSA